MKKKKYANSKKCANSRFNGIAMKTQRAPSRSLAALVGLLLAGVVPAFRSSPRCVLEGNTLQHVSRFFCASDEIWCMSSR